MVEWISLYWSKILSLNGRERDERETVKFDYLIIQRNVRRQVKIEREVKLYEKHKILLHRDNGPSKQRAEMS
jgi:hypothetical protein